MTEPLVAAPLATSPSPASPALVASLDLAADLGRQEVGRKALNLAVLAAAGLPVPPAVVVTAAAWRRALEAAGLAAEVDALSDLPDAEVVRASARLHDACLTLPVPDDLVAALTAAVGGLPVGPLAVRSSALDEDERERSAAGLFATALDVRGLPAALDAVRACWASLFSGAALAYRRDRGLPAAPRPMAVVLQRCLAPAAAGVLFTRAGAPDDLLVEAVAGAGRALVDGLADPTRWVLDAAGAVREAPARGGDLLAAATLAGLARAAGQVERALGADGEGLDLEWAVEGERLWVLQARPVTREAPAGARGRVRWTAANTQEALLDPVTPLTWTLFAPLVEAGRRDLFRLGGLPELEGPGYMRLFYGLPYFNPDYFRAFMRLIPGAPEGVFDALIFGEGVGGAGVGGAGVGGPGVGGAGVGGLGAVDLDLSRADARTARLGLLFVAARLLARERFELFLRVFALRLRWCARRAPAALDDAALLRLRRDATGLLEEALRRHVLGTAISGAAYLLLELFLRRSGAEAEFEGKLVAHLTAGAPGNALAVASGHLEGLAERAAARPALAEALCAQAPRTLEELGALGPDGRWLQGELGRFLAEFGHRCEKEAELAEPRWADDPSVILAVLGSLVRAARDQGGGMPRLADREERLARRAEALAGRVSRHLSAQGALERALPLRRAAFRALLREARRYAPYRENLKDSALRALHLVRRVFLEVGRRLAVRGLIARPEDVFFLEVDEAEAALGRAGGDLRARVAARRAERAAHQAQDPPRYVIEVPGSPPRPVHVPSRVGHLVEGVGVSGGRVTARARVLRGMEDAALVEPGDIVVARVINAGWTPLFHLVGGIVAEVGGVLSHAAIVAREYGIPAVFGAAGATRITPGARVTVDGDLGIVTVEEA